MIWFVVVECMYLVAPSGMHQFVDVISILSHAANCHYTQSMMIPDIIIVVQTSFRLWSITYRPHQWHLPSTYVQTARILSPARAPGLLRPAHATTAQFPQVLWYFQLIMYKTFTFQIWKQNWVFKVVFILPVWKGRRRPRSSVVASCVSFC